MFTFFYFDSECFAKYDAFCSHDFDYACLRRRPKVDIVFEEVRNYGKIVSYTSKTFLKMAGGRGSAPGHKLQKPSKESGILYFRHLVPLFCSFLPKGKVKKGEGPWHYAPLKTLLRSD